MHATRNGEEEENNKNKNCTLPSVDPYVFGNPLRLYALGVETRQVWKLHSINNNNDYRWWNKTLTTNTINFRLKSEVYSMNRPFDQFESKLLSNLSLMAQWLCLSHTRYMPCRSAYTRLWLELIIKLECEATKRTERIENERKKSIQAYVVHAWRNDRTT